MTDAPILTDRKALTLHRQRAARDPVSFLHEAVADEMQERLAEVNKSFNDPLLVGHATAPFIQVFKDALCVPDAPELVVQPSTHDLALHLFGLHWANDPVGQLVQCRLALKPDGLFLAALFGGQTLRELRACLAEAEARLDGGLSPRILPMADIRDLGGLLQRAGFALPVADSQTFTIRYPSLSKLVRDLRGMGETNALEARNRRPVNRTLFAEAERLYHQNFGDDGYLNATFEVIYLTGWAPASNQPQPLRPGSATTRLSDALGVPEIPLKR